MLNKHFWRKKALISHFSKSECKRKQETVIAKKHTVMKWRTKGSGCGRSRVGHNSHYFTIQFCQAASLSTSGINVRICFISMVYLSGLTYIFIVKLESGIHTTITFLAIWVVISFEFWLKNIAA